MNWTSSFLVQSDKLAIVLHLLLAPVGTVVKLVELELSHRPDPSLESPSSNLQQGRGRTGACSSSQSESGCGVTMLSAESKVDAMLGWWKNMGFDT